MATATTPPLSPNRDPHGHARNLPINSPASPGYSSLRGTDNFPARTTQTNGDPHSVTFSPVRAHSPRTIFYTGSCSPVDTVPPRMVDISRSRMDSPTSNSSADHPITQSRTLSPTQIMMMPSFGQPTSNMAPSSVMGRASTRDATRIPSPVNIALSRTISSTSTIGQTLSLSPSNIMDPTRTQSLGSKIVSPNASRLNADEKQRILILNPDFVTLRSDLLEQEKATPRSKVYALIGKFSILMFLNCTLGGGGFVSPWGIQCGSVAFWVVHVIMVAFLLASAWAAQVSSCYGVFQPANCCRSHFLIIAADIPRQPSRN